MAGHRSGDPLTDRGIDRELAAALAVEPSPEFLARVRTRIASEPEPSAWRLSPMFAAAGAFAIAIAIALAVTQLNQTPLSADLPSRAFGDLSLIPALLPGPLAMAASVPGRVRRQKPTPEMQAIMNSNAEANAALAVHGRERNYDAIVNDAATFRQNFAYIEAFWANRHVEGALIITRRALEAAADLQAAALAKDDSAIEKAMAALIGTCGACHKQYREQLPDKNYEIRL